MAILADDEVGELSPIMLRIPIACRQPLAQGFIWNQDTVVRVPIRCSVLPSACGIIRIRQFPADNLAPPCSPNSLDMFSKVLDLPWLMEISPSFKDEAFRRPWISDTAISPDREGIMRVAPDQPSGGKLNISLYRYLAVT